MITIPETNTELRAEQVAAAFLSNIVDQLKIQNQVDISKSIFAIAVPIYLTEREREAFKDVMKVANLPTNNVVLINETSAVTAFYGVQWRNSLNADVAQNILFVDVGHSHTAICTSSFTSKEAAVLAHASERNFGGRNLDKAV